MSTGKSKLRDPWKNPIHKPGCGLMRHSLVKHTRQDCTDIKFMCKRGSSCPATLIKEEKVLFICTFYCIVCQIVSEMAPGFKEGPQHSWAPPCGVCPMPAWGPLAPSVGAAPTALCTLKRKGQDCDMISLLLVGYTFSSVERGLQFFPNNKS